MNDSDNVLASRLREQQKRHQSDYVALEYGMGFQVIKHFLGEPWCENRVRITAPKSDPWMLNTPGSSEVDRFLHMTRVVNLADSLFNLRHCPGFDHLASRFLTRDTKSCCIEAEIAALFVEDGFQVSIQRETGLKGQDFDLVVTREGIRLNVEVTSKDASQPSASSLRNTLKAKIAQHPKPEPSLLYINLPESWTTHGPALEAILTDVMPEFFRRHRRINAVVFVWEPVVPMIEGCLIPLIYRSFLCPAPRHPVAVSFLGSSNLNMTYQDLIQEMTINPVLAEVRMTSHRHVPSFVEWAAATVVSGNETCDGI